MMAAEEPTPRERATTERLERTEQRVAETDDRLDRIERSRRQPRRSATEGPAPKPAKRVQRVRIRGRVVSRVASPR